jgi:hypothetical protein
MNRDFEIVNGIYLVKEGHELDLHNNYDFKNLNYSIEARKLVLNWERSKGDWVISGTPYALCIEFCEVSEFRFMPRDSEVPFSEDNRVNSIGYWVDEEWADGVIILGPNKESEPQWLTAIDFMSGAVIAVQAERANAKVIA